MDPLAVRAGAAALPPAGWQTGGAALRVSKRLRWRSVAAVAIAAAVAAAVEAEEWLRLTTIASMPPAPRPAVGLFVEPVPLTITVSAGGQRAPWVTTEEEVRTTVELWKRLHLEDWNGIRSPLRTSGLDNMLKRYSHLLNHPAAWDAMTATDWDAVPQPVRTVAYRRMVAYWSGFYRVGAEFDLPPWLVADTLSAIVLSESWLDHRAKSINRDGWDIGLAQASPYARETLRQLHAVGDVDAFLSEDDYYNPWVATRFVAVWMKLMLEESGGDLPRAVRAYNRGSPQAMDALGAAYFATVQRRLQRYIRNVDSPVSWDFVWRRSQDLIAAETAGRSQEVTPPQCVRSSNDSQCHAPEGVHHRNR